MIRPIGQNIVVQKDPQPPLQVGGILIPESAERTPRFAPTILATVMGVGAKVKELKVGDRVAVKAYAGDEMYVRSEVYTLMREKDIVGFAQPS